MTRQEMRAPHLDARLAAAAAYVRPGSAAADVGCDHGKLAAYLAASGRCPRVIASDVRAQPWPARGRSARSWACRRWWTAASATGFRCCARAKCRTL